MTLSLDQQKTRRLYDLQRPAVGQQFQGVETNVFTEDPEEVAVICFTSFGVTLRIPFEQVTLFAIQPPGCDGPNPRVPLSDSKFDRLCLLNRSPVTFEIGPLVAVDEPNREFSIRFNEFGLLLEGSLDQVELAPVESPPPSRGF